MRLRAWILPSRMRGVFHVKLPKGVFLRNRMFACESVVQRHIGPRPWAEMSFVDQDGYTHHVFSK
jgi:hypothetical protein